MNKTALLIPHYNNPEGLMLSVASIGADEKIDIFIVDDGSTVKTIKENDVSAVFKAQGLVKFIYLKKNKGIEHALNAGLMDIQKTENYKYVARLDCGDICAENRFSTQEKFLDSNQNIMIVGSNAIAVDTNGKFLFEIIEPEQSAEIRKKMFLNCMFVHPTVMFRIDIVKLFGGYPVNRKSAEDYAFFSKVTKKYDTANIQESLVTIEINPDGISISKRREQLTSRLKVILDNFYFGFYPIYGLIRNLIIYLIPNRLIMLIKKVRDADKRHK
ncbi:MAG: glycosyl transferase family 2 [Flavobacterium psychrophilum]|nr:MAG: glycosyl transferase family 2 [Flavobacterium psychrophilum]